MTVRYDVADHIATITLDRPERRNAFTPSMVDEWQSCLRRAAVDDEVRVVVLTGAPGAFCSGIDLSELAGTATTPLSTKRLLSQRIHGVARALEDLDRPTIAAINGVAVGAGLDMALLCDMRLAARSARMSEGYIKVGLVPGDGGAWLLPRLVGPAKAMELLLTGETIDGEQAHALGLVNHVVDDDRLLDRTYELAARIAAAPPVQVATIRRLVRQSEFVDLRTHLDLVSSHAGLLSSTDDYREAGTAFKEKRPGHYTGT